MVLKIIMASEISHKNKQNEYILHGSIKFSRCKLVYIERKTDRLFPGDGREVEGKKKGIIKGTKELLEVMDVCIILIVIKLPLCIYVQLIK
jgi:hypothetical protein